jgi:3-phenylpropionate/trans-cinnamate dioxygenase ferredoxin component
VSTDFQPDPVGIPVEQFVEITALADLPAGAQRSIQIGPVRVLLCHDQGSGRIHAIENRCPHAFQPLEGGEVRRGTIQCPKHGACFDLASGRALNNVTDRPVKTFAVRIEDERVFVALQAAVGNSS